MSPLGQTNDPLVRIFRANFSEYSGQSSLYSISSPYKDVIQKLGFR